MSECDHAHFDLKFSLEHFADTNVMMGRLIIRCLRCQQFMRFVGCDDAQTFSRPTAHDRARALSIPMVAESEVVKLPFTHEGTALAS